MYRNNVYVNLLLLDLYLYKDAEFMKLFNEFVDLSKCQLAASSYCSDDPKPIVESGIDSDGFDISNVSPLLAGILVVGGGIAFILLVIGIVFLLRKK